MNKFQQLIQDLDNWHKQSEDYVFYANKLKQELNNIDRTLNDFRHMREIFQFQTNHIQVLERLDFRECELLQRRREIKAELLHYEKCRIVLESIQKQTKSLLKPTNHHYHNTYQVKTNEGDEWFQLFEEHGLEPTIKVNPFTKSKRLEQEPYLIEDEEHEVSLEVLFENEHDEDQRIKIHINRNKKYWLAYDLNLQVNIVKARKLVELLDKLPANVEILKMPKANTKFIRDYRQQNNN